MKTEEAGGIAIIATLFFTFVVFIVISAGRGHDIPDGVTGADLRLQVDICTPLGATWEQELACTQAVYGHFDAVQK